MKIFFWNTCTPKLVIVLSAFECVKSNAIVDYRMLPLLLLLVWLRYLQDGQFHSEVRLAVNNKMVSELMTNLLI